MLARTAAFSWLLIGMTLMGYEVAAQCTPPVTSEPPQYAAGIDATSVASGDFNGDGIADLAVANKMSSNISILIGDGAGGFGPPINSTVAMEPNSVAVSDFNKDGKADLVVGHFFGGGPVSVLLGVGSGKFSTPIVIPNIPGPNTVAVGDFNGDSNPDIAVGSYLSNLRILLGDGAGGFSVKLISPSNSGPSIVAADFNGDGLTDLVSTSDSSGGWKVSVVHGNSTGNFFVSSIIPLSQAPKAIASADFNGDGRPDVAVVAEWSVSTLHILLNDGAGSFGTPASFAVNQSATALATADFNGDGKMDVAVVSVANHSFQVFLGDGQGNFTPVTTQYAGGITPVSLVARDFNADGKIDLVAANGFVTPYTGTRGTTVSVLLGDGAGRFDSSQVFSASPCITVNDVTVTEGDTGIVNADFTVTLSEASAQVVRVNYTLKGVTATEGADYTPVLDRLVFQPGETSKTISVPIVGDTSDEVNETFEFKLASPARASIGDATGIGTITNNDTPPVLSINDITFAENVPSPSKEFTVTLSAPSGKDVTVEYAAVDGTAIGGAHLDNYDYHLTPGTLTIRAGQTSANIRVNVTDETTFEPDETFFLNLSNPTNASLGDAQGKATITNDDPLPGLTVDSATAFEFDDLARGVITFSVNLSNASSQAITVNYATSDGTAVAGSDYVAASGTLTFAPLETHKTITVTVKEDVIDETDETFTLTLTNIVNASLTRGQGTGFIRDNDGPTISIDDISVVEGNSGTTNAIFTVSLSAPSVQSVRANFATANGTALYQNSDYIRRINATVTVPAGATSTSLIIPILPDTIGEADETFYVNLTNPVNGEIGDGQGIATIINDDGPSGGSVVHFTVSGFQQHEGDGRANFTIKRTGDISGTVTVDYRTVDTDTFTVACSDPVGNAGGAYARCDFATTVGRLTFAPGEFEKVVAVPIIDDAHSEASETFQLHLSNVTGTGATLHEQNVSTVTISDTDVADNQSNPIYTTPFFVRQQYLDFLSREPDAEGFQAWSNVLRNCPNANTGPNEPSGCDRIYVSGEGFFRSTEFQLKGFYVFRFYKAAFNRLPEYTEIVSDMSFVAGATAEEVYARKAQLATLITQRQEFQTTYGGMTNAQFVAALLGRYNLQQVTTPDPAQPDTGTKVTLSISDLTDRLNANQLTRAQVLRAVADSDAVGAQEFNNAFVGMQYYGYLRRKPDDAGFQAWLRVLQSGDGRTMVNGFLNSMEYKLRFGRP